MRKLESQTNVNAPDANYPNGSTRDKAGGTPGTVGGVGIFGDIIQFIQKCVIISGITVNEIADNVTNGYQVVEAVAKAIGTTFNAYILADGTVQGSKGVEAYTINKNGTGIYEIVELINENDLFERYNVSVQPINDTSITTPLFATIFQPSAAAAITVRLYDSDGTLTDGKFFLTVTKL